MIRSFRCFILYKKSLSKQQSLNYINKRKRKIQIWEDQTYPLKLQKIKCEWDPFISYKNLIFLKFS